MDRRLALAALWAVFAAAAVGVGFGAAGLVGDPFTDGVGGIADAAPLDPTGGTGTPTGSASPSPRASDPPTPTGSASPSPSTTADATPAEAVTRAITTRGGFVSATCRAGLVRVSGSPEVGWEIDDIDRGRTREARVRFEPPDGDGRVEVEATCSAGRPEFALDDDPGDDDDDDRGDD